MTDSDAQIYQLVSAGCSPPSAFDYWALEIRDMDPENVALLRGTSARAIEMGAKRAKEQLAESTGLVDESKQVEL